MKRTNEDEKKKNHTSKINDITIWICTEINEGIGCDAAALAAGNTTIRS